MNKHFLRPYLLIALYFALIVPCSFAGMNVYSVSTNLSGYNLTVTNNATIGQGVTIYGDSNQTNALIYDVNGIISSNANGLFQYQGGTGLLLSNKVTQSIIILTNGTIILNNKSNSLATLIINTNQLVVTNGNVGFGTAIPGGLVHISKANGAGDVAVIIQNYATTNGETASLLFRTTTSALDDGRITVERMSSGESKMHIYTTTGGTTTERVTILNSGNFGIGTNAPSVNLHVVAIGVSATAEDIVRFGVSDEPNSYFGLKNGSGTDGVFIPRIFGRNASTNTGMIVQGMITTDSGTEPALQLKAADVNGNALTTRPTFNFVNASTVQMSILASGNVGIGTTNITHALDVNGTVSANTIISTNDITSKRLLTTMQTLSIVGTNVAVDFSAGNKFALTLTTNVYFTMPLNLTAMQDVTIDVRQDATGARTVGFDTNYWKFPSTQILTITTNASSWNIISCVVGQFGTNVAVVQTLNFQ